MGPLECKHVIPCPIPKHKNTFDTVSEIALHPKAP